MRVLVSLPERLYKQIEKLCDDGRYDSVSTFLRVAAENQLLLEEDDTSSRVVVNGVYGRSATVLPPAPSRSGTYHVQHSSALDHEEAWRMELREAPTRLVRTFNLTEELFSQPDVLPLASAATDVLPGLISRLLPVKFAVRVLYSILGTTGKETVELHSFLDKVGEYALRMGDRLAEQDRASGRRREEGFAAGFPTSSRDAGKSKDRYRNLFVASVRSKERRADGALPFLKLSVLREVRGEVHIGLTSAGGEFARISNPVIDGTPEHDVALSIDERNFLIEHVRRWVPGEYKAAQLVLAAVNEGITDRSALNEILAAEWDSWSADQVNSWRSGLLSRLSELGLLERLRDGRTLEYRVSRSGRKLLAME